MNECTYLCKVVQHNNHFPAVRACLQDFLAVQGMDATRCWDPDGVRGGGGV